MQLPSPSVRAVVLLLCLALVGRYTAGVGRAAGSKRPDPNIVVRFHTQVSTFDPSFSARVTAGNPPRALIVEKIPSISEHEITSFYPYKAADGTFAAAFQLDPHGAAVLEALSVQNRGRYLLAAVNARPVALLAIDKRISDGVIYIPSGLTLDEIHKLGESFSLIGQTAADKERRNAPKESTFSDPASKPQ